MNGRQACPQCGRRWEPPGPCPNMLDGETCAYREPDRPADRVARQYPTRQRFAVPSSGYAATGRPVDPRPFTSALREQLAQSAERKAARRRVA